MVRIEVADRDVVEEEQGFRSLAHEVIHAHRDEVGADGVDRPAACATSAFVPTPSVEDTSTGCRNRWAGNSNKPPKPPMSPITSGRNVERTLALMRSTASSPAAMLTPAPL